MTLLADIKHRFLAARKQRDVATTLSLSALIGEAEMIGKTDGNRETTDAEVAALLKKFIKNATEVAKLSEMRGIQLTPGNGEVAAVRAKFAAENEIKLYTSFLPPQMSDAELITVVTAVIEEIPNATVRDMGKVMAKLKADYDGRFDGATASKLIKSVLA